MTRKLWRGAAVCALIFLWASHAASQTAQPPGRDPAPRQGTTADETFNLDITERRITESDFNAATSVESAGRGARTLNLRVGVAVHASEIDVLLRNVRGSVRFRGNLEPLLRLLESRRAAPASATTTGSPP